MSEFRYRYRAVHPDGVFPPYLDQRLRPRERGRRTQAVADLRRMLDAYVRRFVQSGDGGVPREWVLFAFDLAQPGYWWERRAPDGTVWGVKRLWE